MLKNFILTDFQIVTYLIKILTDLVSRKDRYYRSSHQAKMTYLVNPELPQVPTAYL